MSNRAAADAAITITAGYVPKGSRPLPRSTNKYDLAAEMRAAQTPPELALWEAAAKLRKHVRINRQQVIRGFIADFYLPEYRAIIEVDGDYHRDPEQTRKDNRREDLFRDWGYSVLRLRARLVMADASMCVEIVAMWAEELDEAKRDRGSTTSLSTWTFSDYGLLERRNPFNHKWEVEHWFRLSADLPAETVCNYGGDIGDVDTHPWSDCDKSRCDTWVVE